ncbi:MAG: shikimate dehydrogenase [Bacteroidetes bacterium]|nr:MAG: shikimate dehydrogenase [Bacteroidota bacterium]TAG86544.1 MAG: shikimate dehydrogenase [Bacteroidota bacterium]
MVTSKKIYGLVGYPLSHSFSPKYFQKKFQKEKIDDVSYELFLLENINLFPNLFKNNPNLQGVNVTIPYKQTIIPFLDELDESAKKVGAVNVVKKLKNGQLKGYNSDIFGLQQTFDNILTYFPTQKPKALIFGTGGAAKAVEVCLNDYLIDFQYVSRQSTKENCCQYENLTNNILENHLLWINTTPVGMYPHNNQCLPIVYDVISPQHFLLDLIYNPEETLFLLEGKKKNANIQNGLQMLHAQAEKSWEIWQSNC